MSLLQTKPAARDLCHCGFDRCTTPRRLSVFCVVTVCPRSPLDRATCVAAHSQPRVRTASNGSLSPASEHNSIARTLNMSTRDDDNEPAKPCALRACSFLRCGSSVREIKSNYQTIFATKGVFKKMRRKLNRDAKRCGSSPVCAHKCTR